MAYIGKQPTIGNFVKLDAITTSATATYNLTNGGIAYSPQSANHCLVSLNGVIQEPTSASNVGGFTISGSTIVFTSALTATDVIDFILVLGDVLNIGTPSDATVGFSKVTSNLITGATAETSIAGGDSILIYDDSATALRKMTRTNFVAGIGAAAGQVIQVVTATITANQSTSSTSYVDATSLSVSITPSSASNKVLILFTGSFQNNENTLNSYLTILRGATNLATTNDYFILNSAGTRIIAGSSASYVDSPNTTSSTTYKIQIKAESASTATIFANSTITVLEIKG